MPRFFNYTCDVNGVQICASQTSCREQAAMDMAMALLVATGAGPRMPEADYVGESYLEDYATLGMLPVLENSIQNVTIAITSFRSMLSPEPLMAVIRTHFRELRRMFPTVLCAVGIAPSGGFLGTQGVQITLTGDVWAFQAFWWAVLILRLCENDVNRRNSIRSRIFHSDYEDSELWFNEEDPENALTAVRDWERTYANTNPYRALLTGQGPADLHTDYEPFILE